MKRIGLVLSTFVLGIILMAACNDDDTSGIQAGKGKVNIYLTDAPFPIDLIAETYVTIDKVEIRKQETDSSGSDFIVLTEEPMEIDLLTLSNGVTEILASVDLEAGTYDQIRMHVSESKVVMKDATEFDLKVPSGSSSGLKIKIEPALEISGGETADVLLDFDVSKSFVAKGNWQGGHINGFNFKPVVRCVMLGKAGRIEGTVSDTASVALENASVKVWMPLEGMETDSLITSSFSDEAGKYKIIGLLSGTYYLTTELEGYETDTVWNVGVTEGNATVVDIQLTPVQ
ncbi:DUF4382 domain-containing protein [Maribellus sp. CM-23]|uniref:DUF4382 domain-containing protein n=1 Tax=Maribellus sp. CM-23 TaxID=2781026 RepID=UPI001F1CC480|nr:DUF4382 domain-containing protein [Maribellus sp. CM-23]MCE4566119.1 DUF4382 domain-containing protein [Maribellus sp. CM-23]